MRTKRILSMVLTFCLCLAMLPDVSIQVEAATYNASAAVSYANAHWNDGVGLCAEFVSKCLGTGGVTIPNSASYYSSSTQSYNNNSGTLGIYTNPYTCSASLLLYLSKYYTVITDPTSSQIDIGDVVFMYSGQWRDGHVGIIINKNDGIPTYAAHNRATNTGKFYSNYPCTYVVKMNGVIPSVTHTVDTSFGTDFSAYPKEKITAENIFDAYHNQRDSTSWIGNSDNCTIHEVYTDGCCKVTYPLDAGGTKTVYSKISLFNIHTHSYTGSRYYESAHPHAITQRCVDYDTCGGWIYTGEYNEVKTCEQCWHATFDVGASSVSVEVGESKTISASVSGCLPDSAVLGREFTPDNGVVSVTIAKQKATFTGLKEGTTELKWTVYSDSSMSHAIAAITIPVTVTMPPCTDHSYAYEVTTKPTTSEVGTLTGTCSNCSDQTIVTLPKLMTVFYTYEVTKAATCTATGIGRYTWKVTTYGNFYFNADIAPTGHSYSYRESKAPTTSAAGTLTGSCSKCFVTTTVDLPKLNTTDYTYTVMDQPTCTQTGTGCYTLKDTTYGNQMFAVSIPEIDHSYSYKATKTPTASATGTLTGTCSKCSGTTKVTLPKLNNTDYRYKLHKEATCTEAGTEHYTLKNTSYGNFTFIIPVAALGHTVGDDNVCDRCGYSVYITGDLTGDDSVDEDDAIFLLQHVLLPDIFSVSQKVDYTKNGIVDEDDAIYLLQHLLLPELFPIS